MTAPLYFLSGFTLSRPVWQFQEVEFSKQFDLHFFEQDQFKDSPVTFLEMAEHLAKQIHSPGHLIGHSMGGMIAQLFALHYPQKLKSLTLVCTSPKFISSPEWPYGIRLGAHKILDKQINQNLQEGLGQFVKAATADHLNDYPSELLKIIRQASVTNKIFATRMMQELAQFDVLNKINTLRVPTLLFCGEKDPLCPPAATQTLNEKITGSQLYQFKNEGHFPFLTQPALFNQKVLEFITSHD